MGIDSNDLSFGKLKKGPRNKISDVPGVLVGHVTLAEGSMQTGVTALIPGPGSAFREKFPAAVHVINGFGKSTGLMQVEELGTLEAPILMTNTFSVAACTEGLLSYMLDCHPEIGLSAGTVNTVVTECNDGRLNAIRERFVRPEHALQALENASADFEEGAVGAGRGMVCYGYKGGIGSASRIVEAGGREYTVGALLMTNFGSKGDLSICGRRAEPREASEPDKGSCIIILATDMPLSTRQLKRCARRAQNGLARTGSVTGNGSGEVVIAFGTALRIPHDGDSLVQGSFLKEDLMDAVFRAVGECVEESVISSLYHACTVEGRDGNIVRSAGDCGLFDM